MGPGPELTSNSLRHPDVWAHAQEQTYVGPREDNESYGSAARLLQGIRDKSLAEPAPGLGRMGGPLFRQELRASFDQAVYVAPLGMRPTATAPFFRAIHDGTAPGLSHRIRAPGHARRPQIEELRTVWRSMHDRVGFALVTKDARLALCHGSRDWG